MYVDRVLSPVVTLGPGKRVAIWLAGCSKRCPGCANPELWETDDAQWLPVRQLADALLGIAGSQGVSRLTVTGGDPLEQAADLVELLELVRHAFSDVLVYTGYTMAEAEGALPHDGWRRLLACVDVIVDGRYVEELNDGRVALRGSTNQQVHYVSEAVRDEYEDCLAKGRVVQNFAFGGRVVSVGIHNREEVARGGQGAA